MQKETGTAVRLIQSLFVAWVDRYHIVEVDGSPFSAVDFKEINLVFHMQMFGFGGSQRRIVVDIMNRKYNADKGPDGFSLHRIGHTGIAFSQIIAIRSVHHIK